MVNGDRIASVLRTFQKYEQEAFARFFPGETVVAGGDLTVNCLNNIGGPSSDFYKIVDKIGSREYPFWLRVYGSDLPPSTYPKGALAPWTVAAKGYAFMEEAGVSCHTRCLLPKNSRILILESLEGIALAEATKNTDPSKRIEFLDPVLDCIVDLQFKADKLFKSTPKESRENVFIRRPLETQARDYFEKVFKTTNPELIEEYTKAYAQLIGKALSGDCVSHGDFGDGNVIVSLEKGAIKTMNLIDPELKDQSSEFRDLGSKIAYAGYDLEKPQWVKLAEILKRKRVSAILGDEGMRTRMVGISGSEGGLATTVAKGLGVRADTGLTEDEGKWARFSVYGCTYHYSLRISAKNQQSHRFKDCSAQRHNMHQILEDFVSSPRFFGLSKEDWEDAIALKEVSEKTAG